MTNFILIADAGGSGTTWALVDISKKETTQSIQTKSIHPTHHSNSFILNTLKNELVNEIHIENIKKTIFYGAGCYDVSNQKIISKCLSDIGLSNNIVESDMLGACRSVAKQSDYIIGILGTGSNSCVYVNQKITSNIPALGFILGDEGSGAHLGKILITDYLYQYTPKHICDLLKDYLTLTDSEIISKIYKEPNANTWLASITKFISNNIKEPYLRELIFKSFNEYTIRHILPYPEKDELPIGFIGSIAFVYQDLLKEVLGNYSLGLSVALKDPINGLIDYHITYETN